LPSIGAAMLVAWAVERTGFGVRDSGIGTATPAHADRGDPRRALGAGSRPPILIPLAAAFVLCAFAVRSWTRTTVWHDDKRLVLNSLISDPESYRTHLRAALILGYRKDWAGAAREYAVARTLFPDDPYVFEAAAMIADAQDQYAAADRLYDSASIVMPGLADVYLKQARLRYRASNYAGAIRSARAAYLAAPDSVAALDVLTGAAQHLDDFASAEWAFRRGLADHPGNASLHQQYAWMLAAKGDTAASRRQAALAARLGVPAPSTGAGRAPSATPTAASAPRGPAQGT
jgi:Tfp pilus assembly protein PilF